MRDARRQTNALTTYCLTALKAFLFARPTFAWGPQGHMMVAAVAWEDLKSDPAGQTVLDRAREVLAALPDKDNHGIETGLPQSLSTDKRNQYIFMKAATWPDIIRTPSNPQHHEHRPSWHFIDLPINLDGENGSVPPADISLSGADLVALASDSKSKLDALQALQLCEVILRDNAIPAKRRAIALCWYLHLAGDIHQPLHAVSVFSSDFPVAQYPDGDRSGNREAVNDNGRQTTLHPLWDSYPGTSSVPSTAAKRAAEWGTDPDLSRSSLATELGVKDYSAWADESKALALTVAYRNGTVRGGNDDLIKEGQSVIVPTLPQGYDDDALTVVHQRIFLAGHRLADKLKDALH